MAAGRGPTTDRPGTNSVRSASGPRPPAVPTTMTCQKCRDDATVHLTESVDGQLRQVHLCGPCAREAGLVPAESKPPDLGLDLVVQGLILAHVGELVGALAQATCPDCGLKFMEFRIGGRLGCPGDYEAFDRGLRPLLRRAHGATRHVGKVPRRRHDDAGRRRLRARALLREAVAREDYEQAARLRDQLRPKDAPA
jgi:protein arginine kinase activator